LSPAVLVEDLRIAAGGRVLLEGAELRVEEGECVLLVGGSGTGKSLLLGLLAGLARPEGGVEIRGRVEVLGEDALRARDAGIPGVGIVFQDFALFDDLDAEANVRFGADHAPGGAGGAPAELLREFHLPGDALPSRLSGGMRQRLAIARLLAANPRLVLYDEPTSGLDPAMKEAVARRIRSVHETHAKTTVIVSHDLEACQGIADRVILLDSGARRLREVPVDRCAAELGSLPPAHAEPEPAPGTGPAQALARVGLATWDALVAAGAMVLALWPRPPSWRWGLWHFARSLHLVALGSALPFVGLAGLIAGFVTAFFMFSLMPVKEFTEPVLSEEYIGSLGFALHRVVVPGLVTILFATRSGAALAADLGGRVLTRQIDALRSFGVPPARYLLTSALWASLAGIPLLDALAYVLARLSATAVFLGTHPGHGAYAFDQEFLRLAGGSALLPGGSAYVLAKLLLSALGTAAIAYHVALRPKPSGAAVALGVTRTIIRATVWVLTVHLVFAFFEF
jgi:ABC-type multidrug transport system ATPase subunit/ABC-type transporter Mla maintaining outer membrane lipid asymmetry permease subunit MlaE